MEKEKAEGLVRPGLTVVYSGLRIFVGVLHDGWVARDGMVWLGDAMEVVQRQVPHGDGRVALQIDLVPPAPSASPRDLEVRPDVLLDVSKDVDFGTFYERVTGKRSVVLPGLVR